MLTSCAQRMPFNSTPYLWRYHRYRPQIGTYSVISEKGHNNGRISPAQQIASTEQRFQRCIFNMYAQTGVTPVLHTCFIKFLPSFAQTSVMAFCDVKRSCAGLILPFLCPFSEIAEYAPIWGRRKRYLHKYGVELNGIPASQPVSYTHLTLPTIILV